MFYDSKTKTVKSQEQIVFENKTTSFPATFNDDILKTFNLVAVKQVSPPKASASTKKIVADGVETVGNVVQQKWVEADKTSEEIAHEAKAVRSRRDMLLAETDWWAISENAASYSNTRKKYRDDLRNISSQSGFPTNVVFPEKP